MLGVCSGGRALFVSARKIRVENSCRSKSIRATGTCSEGTWDKSLPGLHRFRQTTGLSTKDPLPGYMLGGSVPTIRRTARNMETEIQERRPLTSASSAYVQAAAEDGYGARSQASLATVFTAVAVAGCGAFLFGYHLACLNGILEQIASDLGFATNATLQGFVVSLALAGAAAGSLGGSGLADRLGRKKSFLWATVPLVLGPLICASATSVGALLAGRTLVGIGIGLSSALVPLYISEIAPTRLRGTLGSLNQLLICVGILGALVVNVMIPADAWRTVFALALPPAVLLGLGMTICPESPAWLKMNGRREDAEMTAKKLWGSGGLEQLGDSSSEALEGSPRSEPTMTEVLQSPGARVGAILFLLQQFSGINAVIYFSTRIFSQAGVTSGAAASALVGAVNVAGTVLAAGLMEKAGRKQLLMTSFTGMGICMLVMALGMTMPQLSALSGTIALVGTVGYILAFACGTGPVPGLLVPEMTAARVRGRAVALAMGTHWVCNFVIGQAFLPVVAAVGVAGAYTFFSAVCVIAVLFIGKFVVETKGQSPEAIEKAMASL